MILDTNGLSALADGESSIEPILKSAPWLAVPAVVLGEYRFGIRESRFGKQYQEWLEQSIPAWRVLEVNAESAEHYAAIRHELKLAGTPIPSNDLWIAALVRQHAMPLVSRDRHFDQVNGLTRIGW